MEILVALSTMAFQLGLCIFCFKKKNEALKPSVTS